MINFPFKVGDIVALKSHPYQPILTEVLISGDPLLLSPLFTIIEIVKEKGDHFDKEKGIRISCGFKCKCVWYSTKTGQFEEKWIYSTFLKHIYENDKKLINKPAALIGKQVSLVTYALEANKRKVSLSAETTQQLNGEIRQTEAERNTVTPFLF